MNAPTVSPAVRPAPPAQAARLAYAGLIPFVVGTLLLWLVYPYPDAHFFMAEALSAYATAVLAFLGGIHWGLTMDVHGEPPRARLWSVVPALVGSVAVLMPPYAGLVVQGAMLIAAYVVDRRLYPLAGLSHWLTLRFRLTAVAAFCCFLGAAGT